MKINRSADNLNQLVCDFLTKNNLLNKEPKWVLKKSELGGLGVFASKDIKAGEIVFVDHPIILGPRVITKSDLCATCYQTDTLTKCSSQCGLWICSKECAELHEDECHLVRQRCPKSNVVPNLQNYITPLRGLLLDQSNQELALHLKKHKCKQHGHEITELQKLGFHFDDLEQQYLSTICSIMDANAFEVNTVHDGSVQASLRGLYPLASLVNHSCVPNIMHVFDEHHKMVARTSVPVVQGEELFHSYSRLIWGTPSRVFHLQRTKHFVCKCKRCCDPTEFGTFMSAYRCKNENCSSGTVVPIDPLDLRSSWECFRCNKKVKREEVSNLTTLIGSILGGLDSSTPEFMLKFLNTKLLTLVGPNHQSVVELKYRLIWILGYEPQYLFQELSLEYLQLKIQFCEDLLKLLQELKLGQCNMRGLLLYELYQANKEINRRTNQSNKKIGVFLDEAADILKYDSAAPLEIQQKWKELNNGFVNK